MTQKLPYRRSAGIALINRDADVLIGRRKKSREDPELGGFDWQMPQGGIDEGETPLAAARRELHEETNVRSATLIAEAPEWLAYDLPEGARGRFGGRFSGRTQKKNLFRFTGGDGEIDVNRPADGVNGPEFSAWRWERWATLPDLVVPFKREVYLQVAAWFSPLVAQRPA